MKWAIPLNFSSSKADPNRVAAIVETTGRFLLSKMAVMPFGRIFL
jgi:hypothetical protein